HFSPLFGGDDACFVRERFCTRRDGNNTFGELHKRAAPGAKRRRCQFNQWWTLLKDFVMSHHRHNQRCTFTKSVRAKINAASIFVRRVLTASSVIAVMPACMLAVPNPGSRNEWSVHCEEGIHHVRPFKFQRTLVNVVVWTIAAHVSRNKNEAAKQHH